MSEPAANRITASVGPRDITIDLDGIPHLIINRERLNGFQSYLRKASAVSPLFYIEVYTQGCDAIIVDYDDRKLWEEVLKALKAARIFNYGYHTAQSARSGGAS